VLLSWRTAKLFVCAHAKARQDGRTTTITVDAPRFDRSVSLTFNSDRYYTKCGTIYNPVDPTGGATVSLYVADGQAMIRYALIYPGGFK
jgi:hypothetical protein